MKFKVTPELPVLIKTLRTQNNVSVKDLAEHLGKSPSYVSKLENGDVKTIQKDDLTSVLKFICGEEDFFGEVLPAVIRALHFLAGADALSDQLWLMQYDVVDRKVPVPAEMAAEMREHFASLGMDVKKIREFINANYDSELSDHFPANEVLGIQYDQHKRLLLRIDMKESDILNILETPGAETSYCFLNYMVFLMFRLIRFSEAYKAKLPAPEAILVLRDVADYMEKFNIHSLTGFSHLLASDRFINRQIPMASPGMNSNREVIADIAEILNEAGRYDALNVRQALDCFYQLLNWDTAFGLKLMSLPFAELENLSYQKKKDLLREIEELLEKYDRMPDFERKIEHY